MARSTGVVPLPRGRERDDDTGNPADPPDREGAATSELAALEGARDEKRRLLEEAARTAGPAEALPAGCAPPDVAGFLQRYYWSEPAAEVLGHEPAELATLALGHLRLAEVRPRGSATVDVQPLPDGLGGGGAAGGRCVVRVVTDDM